MAWDDGGERNAYVVTNDNQRSRFSFVGKAAIDAQWEAGYAIDVGIRAANSKLVNQFDDGSFGGRLRQGFDLRSSVWFLRNKHVRHGVTSAPPSPPPTGLPTPTSRRPGMFDQYAAPENAGPRHVPALCDAMGG